MSYFQRKHFILYDATENLILEMTISFIGNLGYGQISKDGKEGEVVILEKYEETNDMIIKTSLVTQDSKIFLIGEV